MQEFSLTATVGFDAVCVCESVQFLFFSYCQCSIWLMNVETAAIRKFVSKYICESDGA